MINFSEYIADGKGKELYNSMQSHLDWLSIYMDIYNRWVYKYEWHNLPETVSERFLENSLFFRGNACIVDDKKMGKLGLFANLVGMPNVYGEWTKLLATGANGYNKQYIPVLETGNNTNANAVLIRDNSAMFPNFIYASLYSQYLSNLRDTIITTSYKLRNPYLILVDEAMQNSVKKILEDSEKRGKYAVVGSKKLLDKDVIQLFNTNVDAGALTALWDTYDKIENLLRTQMGEENVANPDKRERLLVDEVNSNNETTDVHDDIGLVWRNKACEQMNDLWNTDIYVTIRNQNLKDDQNESEDQEELEDDENNNI